MKPPQLVLLAALLVAPALAAYAPGGAAYTKRISTVLLAEPAPLAQQVTRLGHARKLTVVEVRGVWVRVSDGKNTGWVFAGDLAPQEPENATPTGKAVDASETSAMAAARPLAPEAINYADRRGLGKARHDLEWLVENSKAITDEDVQTYKQAQKKGEFQ